MKAIKLTLPLCDDDILSLTAGDCVLLSGAVYTARDSAHKRLTEALARGEQLPISLNGATIYYAGPAPASPGHAIGACGPTTSGRMDVYTPQLLECGLKCVIGKGERSQAVKNALLAHRALYLACVGGAAALLAKHITKSRIICYEDLGTEAVRELELKDFPAFVALDMHGGDIYRRF